jgi:hypothetical protein
LAIRTAPNQFGPDKYNSLSRPSSVEMSERPTAPTKPLNAGGGGIDSLMRQVAIMGRLSRMRRWYNPKFGKLKRSYPITVSSSVCQIGIQKRCGIRGTEAIWPYVPSGHIFRSIWKPFSFVESSCQVKLSWPGCNGTMVNQALASALGLDPVATNQ